MASFSIFQSPHHGALFIAGGGFLLELQHGIAAIARPFVGCQTLYDYVQRFEQIDSTLLLGLYLWVAILALSAGSLFFGLRGIIFGNRRLSRNRTQGRGRQAGARRRTGKQMPRTGPGEEK